MIGGVGAIGAPDHCYAASMRDGIVLPPAHTLTCAMLIWLPPKVRLILLNTEPLPLLGSS